MKNLEVKVVNSNNGEWQKSVNSVTYLCQTITFEDLGITFDLTKINNDINGNPRVEIKVFKNYQSDEEENVTEQFKGITGRFYKKSQKIVTQCFETKTLIRGLVNSYKLLYTINYLSAKVN